MQADGTKSQTHTVVVVGAHVDLKQGLEGLFARALTAPGSPLAVVATALRRRGRGRKPLSAFG